MLVVLIVREPDEYPGRTARELRHRLPGVLQRFPGYFEQDAMLRIEQGRFTRRDAKELRIELIDAIEESAPARRHFPGSAAIGVVPGRDVPAFGGHFRHGVGTRREQP